jgi:hypothetical protein
MKKFIAPVIAIVVGMYSVSGWAANPESLTRAQVRSELIALQEAGYHLANNDPHYPEQLQMALAKIKRVEMASVDTSGSGAASIDMSESGRRAGSAGRDLSIYRGQ